MKKNLNNQKGFTLIELLAVIVILAILVMLAIPAVTRYLTSARKNTFADNALRAVEAVRNDVVEKGFSSTRESSDAARPLCNGTICRYNLNDINDLLETKLMKSSFGNDYTGGKAKVCIEVDQANNTYTVTMVDSGGNGFKTLSQSEGEIDADAVETDGNVDANDVNCTIPNLE